jgi:hypothetical protein
MGIDRMKQYLKNADDANPGEVCVVVVSHTGEPAADQTARELTSEGSNIRVYSVAPNASPKIADIVLDRVSKEGCPPPHLNRSMS